MLLHITALSEERSMGNVKKHILNDICLFAEVDFDDTFALSANMPNNVEESFGVCR